MIKKLDEILIETTERLGLTAKLEENQALLVWDECVGKEIAKHTCPKLISRGILFVDTANPVWAHKLTITKTELIKKVNDRLKVAIKEIRFNSRGVGGNKKPV